MQEDIDSPTSPSFRYPPALPFIQEHNYSDTSIASATASTISDQDRGGRRVPAHRQVSGDPIAEKPVPASRVFVTKDLRIYVLVDITELDSADVIRKTLCSTLNIQDWSQVAIYHTEVGQTEHGKLILESIFRFL